MQPCVWARWPLPPRLPPRSLPKFISASAPARFPSLRTTCAGPKLIKKYGDVANGGMIKHITYPDNFMTEMETTISQIVSFADDPDMKAVS